MLLTFKDFAKLKGVSGPAVTKAIKSGRIAKAVVNHNGKRLINKDLGLELWEGNTIHNVTTQRKPEKKPDIIAEMSTDEDVIYPDINTSRAKKEFLMARLAEIEVAQKEEELVPAAQVKKDFFAVSRAIREAFLNMPNRLANQLAGETDPAAIDKILRNEIHTNLEQLAEA